MEKLLEKLRGLSLDYALVITNQEGEQKIKIEVLHKGEGLLAYSSASLEKAINGLLKEDVLEDIEMGKNVLSIKELWTQALKLNPSLKIEIKDNVYNDREDWRNLPFIVTVVEDNKLHTLECTSWSLEHVLRSIIKNYN